MRSLKVKSFICLPVFYAFLLLPSLVWSQRPQQNFSAQDYINMYKDAAIKNMVEKRIPASITLAQGMLESGNGNSKLARKGNNHFGIKCHSGWKGKSMRLDDDKKNECFRKYDKVLDSYRDHAEFLSGRDRYASLFQLDITNYKGWAKGLKKAGYATSPTYANKLIDIIERYKLNKFDNAKSSGGVFTSTRINDVEKVNKIASIVVKEGETKLSLATSLDIKVKQIEKFNELGTGDELYPGQLIYIKSKRNRATKGNDIHTVKEDESLYQIAQQYGIKYEKLLLKNNMWHASTIKAGDRIYLRKNKPDY